MNPLEKYPYLFANKKFKVEIIPNTKPLNIIGYTEQYAKDLILSLPRDKKVFRRPVENCTLITRPISDLTDEEKEQVWRSFDTGEQFETETWKEHRSNFEEYVSAVAPPDIPHHSSTELEEMEQIIQSYTPATLEALTIGIYPFDQYHFENGTVINATELKQTV